MSPPMSRDELRLMMREVVEETVKKTIQETLVRMGIEADDPIEAQKDFQHLRSWRKSTESLSAKALAAAVGIIVTGSLAALWAGIASKLHS